MSTDYDLRGRDMDTGFARFGLRHLSEEEFCALSIASMVTPNASPGAAAYLTYVSQCTCFVPELTDWGMMVASGISDAKYRSRYGARRRAYVEGYEPRWGESAVYDAMAIAFVGEAPAGVMERSLMLGVGKQGYQRIRDFIAGAYKLAVDDYRLALAWAMGMRRDSLLESRWGRATSTKWDAEQRHAMLSLDSSGWKDAEGCTKTDRKGNFYATPPAESY